MVVAMKKIALVLLVAVVFILVGCMDRGGEAPSPASGESEPPPLERASEAKAGGASNREDDSDIVAGYPAAGPQEAAAYLEQLHPAVFGFAGIMDSFAAFYIEDVQIDGSDCYKMRMEVIYPEGDVEYNNIFVRTDLGAVYMYNDEAKEYYAITDFDYEGPQGYPAEKVAGDEGPRGYPAGGGDEAAIAFLLRYSGKELGLPADPDEYVVRVDGELEVEGIRCSVVGVYADLGNRMTLMGSYYVAFDNSAAFAGDPQSGGYKALPAR